MSLIQEALKRQQEDSDRKGSMTPATSVAPPPIGSEHASDRVSVRRSPGVSQPAEPPPLEESKLPPPLAVSPPPRKRNWGALLGIAALLLFLLGGGIWLALSFMHPNKEPPAPPPPVPRPSPEITHPGGTAAVLAVVAKLNAAPTTTVSATVSAALPTATVTVAAMTPTPPPAAIKTDVTACPPPVPIVVPPQNLPAVWPSLALSGVMGRGVQGSARINKTIVAVNDSIQGVKVLSVGNQGVELEYKGEKRLLKVGDSTQ